MKNKKEYLNNKDFTREVHNHVKGLKDNPAAQPNDYICKAFFMLCDKMTNRPEFSGYSFKDDMALDAIENCLKAIKNYNIEAATRSGSPNAFGYFSKIIYQCFVRRIQKEKKEFDFMKELQENMDIADMVTFDKNDTNARAHIQAVVNEVNRMREKND